MWVGQTHTLGQGVWSETGHDCKLWQGMDLEYRVKGNIGTVTHA